MRLRKRAMIEGSLWHREGEMNGNEEKKNKLSGESFYGKEAE